jgi:hypothetical protein
MRSSLRIALVLLHVLGVGFSVCAGASPQEKDFVAGEMIRLNDNGAWSWFMDERAVVHEGKLVVGSVRAVRAFNTGKDDPDWGNVEVAVHDIGSGRTDKTVLHRHYEQDDHDGPAFLPLRDGRLLALYSRHGVERKVFWRFSEPGDPLKWGEANEFVTPGAESGAFRGDNVTYSNPFRFPDGRIYNFFRGFGYDPNYMFSEDEGRTWQYGGRFLKGRDGYGPYMKYAFDEGTGTLHFVSTEDHPRNFDNSIYHGMLRADGEICLSGGKPVGKLARGTEAALNTWDVTKVFQGDPDNVGWVIDIELDAEKRPYVAFSVQKDGRGLPSRKGGFDHRYYYARWDESWHVHEMAYAGVRLYPGEDDYTGLVALHPRDPDTVFISTNVEPGTGRPLVSSADGKAHYELFRGTTKDAGKSWSWEAITANSSTDNLRPLVPKWDDPRTALAWMRGTYSNNRGEWTTAVVGLILPGQGK